MRKSEYILYDYNNNPIVTVFHSVLSPKKREYREHHHTECEISVFLSGSGIYKTKSKEYHFKKGDMFLFGSNEAHCITQIDTQMDLLNIHFEPHILWENPETNELIKIFNLRNENFSNKFSDDAALSDIILNVEEELKNKKICYEMQTKYFIYSAILHILRNYNYIKKEKNQVSSSDTTVKLKEAMVYINNNIDKKLTLNEISKIACMSPTYFSAVFKNYNGISPWDYITIKRVEMAIKMLKTTKMTKLEIAEKCGFSSSSNFYKVFYNITGKKPNDYIYK